MRLIFFNLIRATFFVELLPRVPHGRRHASHVEVVVLEVRPGGKDRLHDVRGLAVVARVAADPSGAAPQFGANGVRVAFAQTARVGVFVSVIRTQQATRLRPRGAETAHVNDVVPGCAGVILRIEDVETTRVRPESGRHFFLFFIFFRERKSETSGMSEDV